MPMKPKNYCKKFFIALASDVFLFSFDTQMHEPKKSEKTSSEDFGNSVLVFFHKKF